MLSSPQTVARQAPLSMGFPRQEYWSGWPFPPPGDLPHPGIANPSLLHCRRPPASQASSLLLSHNRSPTMFISHFLWMSAMRVVASEVKGAQSHLTLCSPGKNTGVGRLSLLQRIFSTQELNRSLLHSRRILYQLSYQGSPAVACCCS